MLMMLGAFTNQQDPVGALVAGDGGQSPADAMMLGLPMATATSAAPGLKAEPPLMLMMFGLSVGIQGKWCSGCAGTNAELS